MSQDQCKMNKELREMMLERRQEPDENDFVNSTLEFAWENGDTESGLCHLPS